MQELCNFSALEVAANAVLFENGQIVAQGIDTSEFEIGPFAIKEGCQISCTSECRLSANDNPQAPDAPEDLRTYAGPGFLNCTDGYCETADATRCNNLEDFRGIIITYEDGKATASDIDSATAPVRIEDGCLVDCSDKCTFDGEVTISF